MPIPAFVATSSSTVCARTRARQIIHRLDPVLVVLMTMLAALAVWIAAPIAKSATSSSQRIEVEVPQSTSITPGWQTGDSSVRIPNLSIPGVNRDVTSSGWKLSANSARGYEMRIRATTDPALRGRNAVDGDGALDSFADYSTGTSCPCAWSDQGFTKGIFGYSVSVTSAGGLPAQDVSKWGTQTTRKWRGLERDSYRAYSTPGGAGQYTMSMHFRTMIPEGAIQREGSYRASVVLSAHPLL